MKALSVETMHKKLVSQAPVSIACYAAYEETIVLLAKDPPDFPGWQILALDTERLEYVWRCTTSVLERKALKTPMTAGLRRTPDTLSKFSGRRNSTSMPMGLAINNSAASFREEEQGIVITGICADNNLFCILVALKGGTIFRLSYERVTTTPSGISLERSRLPRNNSGSAGSKLVKKKQVLASLPPSSPSSDDKPAKEITFSLMLTVVSFVDFP
jgi:hypothetical protein